MTYVDAAVAPLRKTGQIKIHGPAAFEGMRKAGQLVARCLDMLTEHVQPGVPTEKIDRLVFDYAMDHGALPATLMYRGYKKSTCTSLNHVVCHGIPGDKPLKEGDIVNIDVTLILDGWHGDSSRMYPIGEIPRRAERLIEVTHEAMMRGIATIRPGSTTGDIGAAIQSYVEAQHMSVVRDFCGHGLGRLFHDEPNIVHVGRAGRRHRAQARHVLHGRADDQSRPPACEGAVRRLDRGDARPLAVGPVRAHRRRHRQRRRGVHLFAGRARTSRRISASCTAESFPRRLHPVALQSRLYGAARA